MSDYQLLKKVFYMRSEIRKEARAV